MKKIFSFVLTLLITFLPVFNTNNLSFADSELNLTAEYAILMDYETGQVLYSKNGNSKLYPASTTKAWTAYVVLKHVNDLNQVVEIKDLPIVDGSSMYLKEGEAFTVKELLDALLIHSSNDVAMVLAKYVGGSVENFVNMMNDEAKSIGAENTHFNNPHGLPDENHYTTAYDMALMARKAMDNKIFRDIVNTKSVKYPATEAYPYERYFENTNQFLTSRSKMNYKGQEIDIKYDVVDGIKTGYTDAAGKCLLSTGVKNNIRVISAVFKSTVDDLYLDSRTLLDYGFDNFYVKEIVDKDDFIKNKKVFLSKEKKLIYQPEANYSVALSNDSKADDYSIKTKLDNIKLPIKEGDKVGTLEVYKNKKLEKSIDLVAKNDVTSIFAFFTENKLLYNVLKIILLIVLLVFIVFIIRKVKRKRKKKKKKNSAYSRNRRRRKH
ncbi:MULTISPECIES: D-alanyl-D-alanine carboxypeptidase family protein [Romboutsia]|jgi:D-alanyl-D-alanine carboxypeptidase (penicillin-binding protein 5/6)|uniref:D-alanyl-D-alanine carboxypeptidase family protein n=1 Tax=Romboutsia TaxID=1501226 RepID=UPI00216EE661|nr:MULTISPECIES: D-alanyl-D-alanine carboxypeptidase family protein [Romboutsia]MCI9062630.1 D-alanyl-D-alanine carboxypeptidase [Romboutsia sp.]